MFLKQNIEVPSNDFSIEDIEPKDIIEADIGGDTIINIRKGEVIAVHEEEERVEMRLPGIRMDGPYSIPVKNIYRKIESSQ